MVESMKWLLAQMWQGICSLFGLRTYNHKDDMCDVILESSSADGERELKQLVRTQLIDNFHLQRKSGSQFAVILLLDGKKSGNKLNFKPCDRNKKPLCNCSELFYPPPTEYVNYIVSRPSIKPHWIVKFLYLLNRSQCYQMHAEVAIFSEFGTLMERFKEHYHSNPNTIVLFSWLFPCSLCTNLIIENLSGANFHQQYPGIQQIIVTYKTYWKRTSKEENERNIIRLRQSGFKVVRIEYKKGLPTLPVC